MSAINANLKVGQKVEVVGKEVSGTIAYIGTTQFQAGKWIGAFFHLKKKINKSYFYIRTCS